MSVQKNAQNFTTRVENFWTTTINSIINIFNITKTISRNLKDLRTVKKQYVTTSQ